MKKREIHNGRNTKLYEVWKAIIQRCENKNNKRYANYGGRGIKMCDEWRQSFAAFRLWATSNGYIEGQTLDRIDNNGNYEPQNCRFADYITQANNRTNNHILNIDGVKMTIAQAAQKYDITYSTLRARLRRGWADKDAVCKKVRAIK